MNHQPVLLFLTLCLLGMISCSTYSTVAKEGSPGSVAESITYSGIDWSLVGGAKWTIENDVIIGQEGLGYLVTDKQYDNFILEADFYPDADINSGIFVRCPNKTGSATDCYEINIWDDHTNQDFRTGSIVTHGKPLAKLNSVGKWNTYKIQAIDNHIEVWLNGIKTADLMDSKSSRGHLALQVFDKGMIKFANVRVSEL